MCLQCIPHDIITNLLSQLWIRIDSQIGVGFRGILHAYLPETCSSRPPLYCYILALCQAYIAEQFIKPFQMLAIWDL